MLFRSAMLKNSPTKPWLTKRLSLSPNSIMEAGVFWETVAKNYIMFCNAFIYVDWDVYNIADPVRGLWIVDPSFMDVKYDDATGEFYFRFIVDGRNVVCSQEDMIHISRHVDVSELFGSLSPAIDKVIGVINTSYEGIENAIKTSAFLRFILQASTVMKKEDRKKKAEEFAETYLTKDGTGVAYLDSSVTFKQVDSTPKYANAEEMKFFEDKIKKFMNTDDVILLSKFNENEWQAYYETNLEPFIQKLQNELERKLFSDREYNQGNRIVIASNMLQVSSLQTKNNIVMATKELGVFSINEYRMLYNLPPVKGGDERYTSLNYTDSESLKKKKDKGGEPNDDTRTTDEDPKSA